MKPTFKTPGRQLHWSLKLWRWLLLLLATLLLCVGALATWVFWDLPDTAAFKDPHFTLTVEVPDWQGEMHPFLVGPKNPQWAPLESIPDELKW